MKRVTKLKVFYTNARIVERLENTFTTEPKAAPVEIEQVITEWDPGISEYDLRAIIVRLKWMRTHLERCGRRTITQTLRLPTGFSAKLYLAEYYTVPEQRYLGKDLNWVEKLVNARLSKQLERGGLVLLRGSIRDGRLHGTIYERPRELEFDEESLIPRLVSWNTDLGVLLIYTSEGQYRVIYDLAYYDRLEDHSNYHPIATVVG